MKKLLTVLLALFMAASFTFWTALPVGAQEDEEDTFMLEEVTVTAEKTGVKDVQKVSASMSVISADELKKNAVTNFADALSDTAGITFMSSFGQTYMRGVGSTTNETGVSPGVQINVDNAPALSAWDGAQSPMFSLTNDVERIEVIRGPSGSVNGRSASAGTINVITKSPDFEKVDGSVGITYGNYDTVQLNAALNLPMKLTGFDLPSYVENLSFRLSMAENKHGPYIHNSDGEGVSGYQNMYSFRGKMKWQPIENLDLNASFNYSREASNGSLSVPGLDGNSEETWALFGRAGMPAQDPHEDDPWLNANGTKLTPSSVSSSANRQYSTNYEATYTTDFAKFYGRYSFSWVPKTCASDDANCTEGKQGAEDYEFRINNPDDSWLTWNVGATYTYQKTFVGPESDAGVIDEDQDIKFQDYYSNGQTDRFGDYQDYFTHDTGWTPPDFDPAEDLSYYFDPNDPTQPWNSLTGRHYLDPYDNYFLTSTDAQRASDAYSIYMNASIPLFGDRHRLVIGLRKNFESKAEAISIAAFRPAATEEEITMLEQQHAARAAEDENYDYLQPVLNGGLPHFTYVGSDTSDSGTWYCDNCYLADVEGPFDLVTEDPPMSFTLGWEYDMRDDVMLYFMVKNGYKPGGISTHAKPMTLYDEETLLAYSLGAKSRWFDQRLQLNFDIYLEDYDGYQQSLGTSNKDVYAVINGNTYYMIGDNNEIVNFPATYIYGFDFDYEWLITPNDRLSGNVAYNHADYADYTYEMGESTMPIQPYYAVFDGRTMPYAPRFASNMSYQHTFNFENLYVTPRISAQAKSKYFLHHEFWMENAGVDMWQDAYVLFDAYMSIGPQDGKWNLNLYWKNLTEEPVAQNRMFGDITLNDPMTYGATFSMNF